VEIHHHHVSGIATVSGLVLVIGTFLPWVRSGAADRHSYELFGLVERLGFAPDGPIGWAIRLWPFVPLLLVTAALAMWWHRRRLGVVLGFVAALYAGGVAVAIEAAPEAGPLRIRFGPWVTLVGAAGLLVISIVEVVRLRRQPAGLGYSGGASPGGVVVYSVTDADGSNNDEVAGHPPGR
jgi:hypothetical protein